MWIKTVIVLISISSTSLAQSTKATYVFGNSLLGLERITTKNYGESFAHLVFNKIKENGDKYTNLAIPGATSNVVVIEVRKANPHDATLVFIECGVNDIAVHKPLTQYKRGTNIKADRLSNDIFLNITNSIKMCPNRADIILFTMPSLHILQPHYDLTKEEKDNGDTHLEYVNGQLRRLESPQITVVELGPYYEYILLNPPKVSSVEMIGFPQSGKFNYITIDGVHPGAITNGLMANLMIVQLNDKWGLNIEKYTDKELLQLYK